MSEWKISRRSGVCTACERTFEDGERHVSTLRLSPEGFARAEFCSAWWSRRPELARGEECAAACAARAAGDGAEGASASHGVEDLSWWFSRHRVDPKRTLRLDLESLERLFLDLEGRAEKPLRELRYVLCLLLMRKRRLKVERVERDPAGESFVVRRPRREERFRVFVFDFTTERMAEVRAELQAIFDGAESLASEGADAPGKGSGAEGHDAGSDDSPAAGGGGATWRAERVDSAAP